MTNTGNTTTAAAVLAHHGITGEGDSLIDNAREAGIIAACLGCGTIVVGPKGSTMAERAVIRDTFDFDCCDDAETVLY